MGYKAVLAQKVLFLKINWIILAQISLMQKSLFSLLIAVCCAVVISGCNKNNSYVTTLNPYMTATMGTYNFTATTVVPSLIDTVSSDSVATLQITGNSSDQVYLNDKVVLYVSRFHGVTGTFSIVQGQANAAFIHNGTHDVAVGGIVAITKVTDNSLVGYFQFTTASGVLVSNGSFSVGNPGYFY
ncbi:MAG: hypothetical protein K0Q79_669 [Flavipsychrobacter sp.]|jgi:hypothetical protein|nr:hypothetical protein [Flavipsychrobacter sp.]